MPMLVPRFWASARGSAQSPSGDRVPLKCFGHSDVSVDDARAQATGIELTWMQQLTILAVAMITSKGASGVTGSGFITLAATLAVVPTIPVAGMVLILGIDRFMSECRALTNIIGNGVATVVVSAWERELDRKRLAQVLQGGGSVADELAQASQGAR